MPRPKPTPRRRGAPRAPPSPRPRARRLRPGQRALQEIRRYQSSTRLLLRPGPFARLSCEHHQQDYVFPFPRKGTVIQVQEHSCSIWSHTPVLNTSSDYLTENDPGQKRLCGLCLPREAYLHKKQWVISHLSHGKSLYSSSGVHYLTLDTPFQY